MYAETRRLWRENNGSRKFLYHSLMISLMKEILRYLMVLRFDVKAKFYGFLTGGMDYDVD